MTVALRSEFLLADFVARLQASGITVRPLPEGDGAALRLLLAGETEIVLTSPFDFAAATGAVDLALVPNIGVTLERSPGLLLLAFNGGLGAINTIALKPGTQSEATAAGILLAEKYELRPAQAACSPNATPAAMLGAADCALLVGDDALALAPNFTRTVELADEWLDTTESPLPYLVAWGRVGGVDENDINLLRALWREGMEGITGRAAAPDAPPRAMQLAEALLRGEISTALDANAIAALEAYFRLPFYHGLTAEIPTIKFLPDGEIPAPGIEAPASTHS